MSEIHDMPQSLSWVRGVPEEKAKVAFIGTMHTVQYMAALPQGEFNKNLSDITKSINFIYSQCKAKRETLDATQMASLAIIQEKLQRAAGSDSHAVKRAAREIHALGVGFKVALHKNVPREAVYKLSSEQLKIMSTRDFWECMVDVVKDPKIEHIDVEGQGRFSRQQLETLVHLEVSTAPSKLRKFVEKLSKTLLFVNDCNESNYSLLHQHIIAGRKDLIEEDLRNIQVDTPDKNGLTALQWASFLGDVSIAKTLIQAGADLNKGDRPPLLQAAIAGDLRMAQFLLKEGANPRLDEAFLCAIHSQNIDAMQYFIDRGADIQAKDNFGIGAISHAAFSNNLDAMKFLLERGVDVNEQDKNGRCALYHAASIGNKDAVQLLLKCGARLDVQDAAGFTPLLLSALSGQLEVFQMLLRAGANPDIVTKDGDVLLYLLQTKRPEHWKIMRQLVLVKSSFHIERFAQKLKATKLLTHVFSLRGTANIGGQKIPFEFGQREIAAAKMAKSCPAPLQEALEFAAEQNSHSPQETLERIKQGKPTCILTGYSDRNVGHAATVLVQGELFMLCDRGRSFSAPLLVHKFDPSKLNEQTIEQLRALAYMPKKEYLNFVSNELPKMLSFEQAPNEKAIIELLGIPNQTVSNCTWASTEGIVKALFLFKELGGTQLPTDDSQKQQLKNSLEVIFSNWQIAVGMDFLEKGIKKGLDTRLLRQSFISLWMAKTLKQKVFTPDQAQKLVEIEKDFLKTQSKAESMRFRTLKAFYANKIIAESLREIQETMSTLLLIFSSLKPLQK